MGSSQQTPKVAKQVAKHSLPGGVLTGVRRWERRAFKPWWTRQGKRYEAEQYSVRIAHDGRREAVNLQTSDLREAGRRAARFAAILRTQGWTAAHEDLAPEQAKRIARRESPTVGCIIAEAERVASHVKPATLTGYAGSLRWVTAKVIGLQGDRSKFDSKSGGLRAWRERVDGVLLGELAPERVKTALAAYRKAHEGNESSLRSAMSLVRQARAYWSKGMAEVLDLSAYPNPFAGISLKQPRPPRYVPTFKSNELVAAARDELRETDSQAWLAFLLMLGAGLRKGEVDSLVWSNVDFTESVVRVTAGKTADSIGDVPIAPEVAAELARLRPQSPGLHVLDGSSRPRNSARRNYRANATFRRIAVWLRAHGVSGPKPLHALRKEAGSLVNAIAGIHAASRFLRHGDIGVTAAHYLDGRVRVVVPVFDVKPALAHRE